MYQVKFWTNFRKRDNSTKLPGDTTHVYDCDLMDGSGMIAPTIQLQIQNPTAFNYAYIDAFRRYYKVTNWHYSLGIWQADLQVDVLASFKSEIGNQTLYVLRSASSWNGRIVDTSYPLIARKTYAIGTMATGSSNPFSTAYNAGKFVVGIVNTDSNNIGAVSYYVFTPAQFKTLVSRLMGDVQFYNVTDISDELTKVLSNPFQYIVSCYWFPFDPPTGGAVSTLQIGWWTFSGISCSRLSGYTRWSATGPTINVPKHPHAGARGMYLYTEPYTEYYLYLPPWGAFSIPADKLIDSDYITCTSQVDCITGMGKVMIDCQQAPNNYLTVVEGQIGVPIMLAQMAPQLGNLMNTMATSAPPSMPVTSDSKALFMGIDLAEIGDKQTGRMAASKQTEISQKITEFAANIGTAILSRWCPAQTIGSNGGVMAGYDSPRLFTTFSYQSDLDASEKGRPLCDRVQLNTLSGYIQCGETCIQIACTKSENDAIRMYLSAGFFYE